MKTSIRLVLFAMTICGLALSDLNSALAQMHHTAASKKFVHVADPLAAIQVLANNPAYNPHLATALAAKHLREGQRTPKTVAGQRFQTTPYDRVMRPVLDKLAQKSASSLAKGLTSGAIGRNIVSRPNAVMPNAAAATSNLSVNFPGLVQTPSVPAAMSGDSSLLVSSLSLDVNQDGKTDLVTVQTDGTINVLLNPGTNSFSDWKITSSNQPSLLSDVFYLVATSADMNKDGYPDLIVTDEINNAAFVYINKKDGTFLPPTEYDFVFSTGAMFQIYGGGIGAGDINGDGYPDLVGYGIFQGFGSDGNQQTTISVVSMLSNGDGTVGAAQPEETSYIAASVNSGFGQLVFADMNKDGKSDLVFPLSGYDSSYNFFTYVAILPGNGDGTFALIPKTLPTLAFPPSTDASYGSFYVGDVNGDGNLDVMFSPGEPEIYLALGNGDGTLQKATTVEQNNGTPGDGGSSIVNYADLNGDGNIDIIAYNIGFIAVYLGEDGGKFSSTPLVQLVSGNSATAEPLPADFNNDGKADIIQVDQTTGLAGLFPQVSGTFAGVPALSSAGNTAQSFQTVAVGDINNDGIPDILALDAGTQTVTTEFFPIPDLVEGINDGKGHFKYSTVFNSTALDTVNANGIVPIFKDLNGDGKADILFTSVIQYTNNGNGLLISFNNGDGTFTTPTPVALPTNLTCQLNYVDIGDLNGDGFPDIVAAYGGDTSCYSYPSHGNTPSGFFVLLNDGKGNFTYTFQPYGFSNYIAKLADLNGDGKLDLVLTDFGLTSTYDYLYGSLYTLPGNGDGTFNLGAAQLVLEQTVIASVIPGDFDGDGKHDLIVGTATQFDGNSFPVYGTTGTYAMKGNGDFTFQLPIQYTPGLFPIDGRYADLNGDGRPDLALLQDYFDFGTDAKTGNFVTMINLGGGAFAQGPLAFTAPTDGAGTSFVADFNNDGAIDVLISPQLPFQYIYADMSELFFNNGGIAGTLAASSNTVTQFGSVTLTETLTPTVSTASPTGTVTFFNNGAALQTIPVVGGVASLAINSLPVGTDSITAAYSGDSNFNALTSSTSVAVVVAALPPAFTMSAAAPGSLTLTQGKTGTAIVTLLANASFSGTVNLACGSVPAEVSCTISPASITLTAGRSVTTTVVVATTAPNNTTQAANHGGAFLKTMGTISVCAIFFMLPVRRRFRSSLWYASMILLSFCFSASVVGCGGASNKYPGTAVGNYTLSVTATSGSINQSTNIAITIAK